MAKETLKNLAILVLVALVIACIALGLIDEEPEDFHAQCERQLPIYMLVNKVDNPDTYCWDAIYGAGK